VANYFLILLTCVTYFPDFGVFGFLRNCFFEKKSEEAFPEIVCIEKLMVPPESVPQELSNEWSCQ
jgi:hypothetical protein